VQLGINKLTYALPAYAGQLTADEKNSINAISRKVMRRGLTLTAFDIDTLIDKSDCKLFRQTTQPGHSLHHVLLPKTYISTVLSSFVRFNIHICFPLFNIRSLKLLYTNTNTIISIAVYLHMYSVLLVTSRCVSLVLVGLCFSLLHQFILCVSCFVYYYSAGVHAFGYNCAKS